MQAWLQELRGLLRHFVHNGQADALKCRLTCPLPGFMSTDDMPLLKELLPNESLTTAAAAVSASSRFACDRERCTNSTAARTAGHGIALQFVFG